MRFSCFVLSTWTLIATAAAAQDENFSPAAQAFRKAGAPVAASSDSTIIAEAEEFQATGPDWQAKPFGTNYYAATFANSFLSRQAYLGAPEQCAQSSSASLEIDVPKAGKYLALARYEAPYRFESRFRLVIEQGGKKSLDRLYGSRDNLRIWAFREKLKKEVAWSWGAVENMVWEGHDAVVELQAGRAKLTLIAETQPEPAARRNVDLVMLTSDLDQVKNRIEKENFLPLDGMLTQAGDVFVKLHNRPDGSDVKLTIPNGTEHSPYWVHLRHWKPVVLSAKPGESTAWQDVGGVLDTLSHGQWNLTAVGKSIHYDLEFGLKNAAGKIEPLRKFAGLKGNVTLAYDGATRYSRRLRLVDEVLTDLVAYLKKHKVEGTAPKRTLIYGYTFAARPADPQYTAALNEFLQLMGATALGRDGVEDVTSQGQPKGYIDVRSVPTPKLEEYCKKLQAEGRAEKIAVVSLGDEIGLGAPPATDHKGFVAWLQSQKLKPSDVDPKAGDGWDKVQYSPKADPKESPRLYYYSKLYAFRFGIKQLKDRSDILRKHLPNAGVGANFSPHHGHLYLGEVHHWMSVFREDGMTMPWGEDYIWQVPVGSQQMNFIMLDKFRAAIKHRPEAKIHYYVMPHTPGNTTASWRRQFFGDLGHGAKVLNLFEFRPVQAAYTENHCSAPSMYQEVRKSIHELGKFEDIVQDGRVLPAEVGIWCSEAADVWHDYRSPFDAAKRCLYIALRHQQTPVDFVLDGDDLKSFRTLVLCEAHVSRVGSKALADWVKAGGTLIATAGAGMFDEFNQPNTTLAEVFGIASEKLTEDKEVVRFEKQDLPFVTPLAQVQFTGDGKAAPIPAISIRGDVELKGAKALATFSDDKRPAVTENAVGKGRAFRMGFLPGLAYFKPAIPRRPVDRGSTDDSMAHFIPTEFHQGVKGLLGTMIRSAKPVVCSNDLVEATVVRAKQGTVIPLVNWSGGAAKQLVVEVSLDVPVNQATLAGGGKVAVQRGKGKTTFTLDLDVADALILR